MKILVGICEILDKIFNAIQDMLLLFLDGEKHRFKMLYREMTYKDKKALDKAVEYLRNNPCVSSKKILLENGKHLEISLGN